MNIQLILCVEADKRAQTDNMYIKQTILRFYRIGKNVKLSFINMCGKSNYKSNDVKRKIKQLSQDYRIGSTVVVYCIDLDDINTNPEQVKINSEIDAYTKDKGYETIVFCRDIEEVFIGRRVDKREKTKLAIDFVKKGAVSDISEDKLNYPKERNGYSNILLVLDKYLERCLSP